MQVTGRGDGRGRNGGLDDRHRHAVGTDEVPLLDAAVAVDVALVERIVARVHIDGRTLAAGELDHALVIGTIVERRAVSALGQCVGHVEAGVELDPALGGDDGAAV